MKLTANFATLMTALALAACGGGGSNTSTTSPAATTPVAPVVTTTPTTPTTPVTQGEPTVPAANSEPVTPTAPIEPITVAPSLSVNPINPYTNEPASGTLTTLVSGMVVSNITVGATVTAYAIGADGSNGAVLGVSSATGADGKFTMQLTSTPTGMVRFVARGGWFTSEADGSKQANTETELVTPFVTTDLNFFVITPATHYVSHLVSYNAKAGSDLVTSYINSFGFFMTLSTSNKILAGDWFAGINLLKTVPGSTDDTRNTYQDLLTAFEWFGVRYDLPSSVVARIFASHAENYAPFAGVDGNGVAINVGKWVNGRFDENQVMTLDELTALRNTDGTVQRDANGNIITTRPEATLEGLSMYSFYLVKACADANAIPAFALRYPGRALIFDSPSFKAGTCAMEIQAMDDLKARVTTNNRSK